MNKQIPKYETIIDFEEAKVKESINNFIDLNQDSDFHQENINDITGNYVLSISKNNFWNGYSEGIMNISVHEHEKKRTKIIVETQNTGMKDSENYSDLAEAQSQFLKALSNILSGNRNPNAVSVPKGKGCLGVFLVLVSIGIGSLFFWF